jgi:mannose-6-phosphate isomerase
MNSVGIVNGLSMLENVTVDNLTTEESSIMSQAQEHSPNKPERDRVNPKGVAATELRPWGSFTILEEGRGYKIKRIEVKPSHRLSLQMHHHRSEHWIVVSGTARVVCGDQEILLGHNESTYVPPCTRHRLENPGMIPLVLIEVQNGEYLGEDDIIRFQDDYARTPSP